MISIKSLDTKMIELFKEQESIEAECEEIDGEIEELEMRKDCLKSRAEGIEEEIKDIKKQILEIRIDELDLNANDKFLMNFIKASWFCMKEGHHPMLEYVKIGDDSLIACDGYKAIRIKTEVPQSLKNKFIRWDVRKDFNDNLGLNIEKYPDVEKLLKDAKEKIKYTVQSLTSNNFYEKVKGEEMEGGPYDSYKINCKDIEVVFNKDYMEVALSAMIGSEFSLNIEDELKPILLENESIEIIILPIRWVRK